MLPLSALFPPLDVALAATLSAWLLGFATRAKTQESTRWMEARAERVRLGALFVVGGMALNLAALLCALTGRPGWVDVLDFLAYPLWIGGGFALATATWPMPAPQAAAWGQDA